MPKGACRPVEVSSVASRLHERRLLKTESVSRLSVRFLGWGGATILALSVSRQHRKLVFGRRLEHLSHHLRASQAGRLSFLQVPTARRPNQTGRQLVHHRRHNLYDACRQLAVHLPLVRTTTQFLAVCRDAEDLARFCRRSRCEQLFGHRHCFVQIRDARHGFVERHHSDQPGCLLYPQHCALKDTSPVATLPYESRGLPYSTMAFNSAAMYPAMILPGFSITVG